MAENPELYVCSIIFDLSNLERKQLPFQKSIALRSETDGVADLVVFILRTGAGRLVVDVVQPLVVRVEGGGQHPAAEDALAGWAGGEDRFETVRLTRNVNEKEPRISQKSFCSLS